MAGSPMIRGSFPDLLDPRFERIFQATLRETPDMVPALFTVIPSNGRVDMRWSEVGEFGQFELFTGSIAYDQMNQGYDVTMTPLEFAKGTQIERRLVDTDQFNVMDGRPAGLARGWTRTRQTYAFGVLNGAFSVDNDFFVHSEGVALCSDSHTTTATGVSTATGFDNKVTSSFSATAVAAAKKQMMQFRNDRGDPIVVMPDELWYPIDLSDRAEEITESENRPDDATNAVNVNYRKFKGMTSPWMTDANDWFMCDGAMRKQNLFWCDPVGIEFGAVEDFDTLIRKYRAYAVMGNARRDWRFILGASVS